MLYEDTVYRKAEVFNGKVWKEVAFKDIQAGQQFRLFENGEIVQDEGGRSSWIANGYPKIDDNGILCILID